MVCGKWKELAPELLQNLQLYSYSRGSVLELLKYRGISMTTFLKDSYPVHMWQLIEQIKETCF
jgi:hypothetical protein